MLVTLDHNSKHVFLSLLWESQESDGEPNDMPEYQRDSQCYCKINLCRPISWLLPFLIYKNCNTDDLFGVPGFETCFSLKASLLSLK